MNIALEQTDRNLRGDAYVVYCRPTTPLCSKVLSRSVLEGQVNLDFIEAACHKFEIERYFTVLIDCDWEIMRERLVHNRQQPDLVNQDMKNWATLLRKQAQRKNLPIIDTSHQTLEQVVRAVNVVFLQAIATA